MTGDSSEERIAVSSAYATVILLSVIGISAVKKGINWSQNTALWNARIIAIEELTIFTNACEKSSVFSMFLVTNQMGLEQVASICIGVLIGPRFRRNS